MKNAFALFLVPLLIAPIFLTAHEGHDHRFLGTVKLVEIGKNARVEIKTRDEQTKTEKVVTGLVNEKTKYFRGNTLTTNPDIQLDERIAVRATGGGKLPYTATEVRLAER